MADERCSHDGSKSSKRRRGRRKSKAAIDVGIDRTARSASLSSDHVKLATNAPLPVQLAATLIDMIKPFISALDTVVMDWQEERSRAEAPWKEKRKLWDQELKAARLWGAVDHRIADSENDFELVVRVSKELEWLLVRDFGAPSDANTGVQEKILAARTANGDPLPPDLIKTMRRLVRVRNSLVHNREVYSIPDRQAFVRAWRYVLSELVLERSRIRTSKMGIIKVLPRQPGDDFVRTGVSLHGMPSGDAVSLTVVSTKARIRGSREADEEGI
jgi:hypothetical protein